MLAARGVDEGDTVPDTFEEFCAFERVWDTSVFCERCFEEGAVEPGERVTFETVTEDCDWRE